MTELIKAKCELAGYETDVDVYGNLGVIDGGHKTIKTYYRLHKHEILLKCMFALTKKYEWDFQISSTGVDTYHFSEDSSKHFPVHSHDPDQLTALEKAVDYALKVENEK